MTIVETGRKAGITSEGLVGELARFMLEGVPTNPDWCENLAICLVGIASACGKGDIREIRNAFGSVRGNIFTIYIGASRLGFKTIPLKTVVRPMLKELTTLHNREMCLEYGITTQEFDRRYGDAQRATTKERNTKEWKLEKTFLNKISGNMVNYEMPESFTSEYLTSWLMTHPNGMICSDEFTSMFKGASKKDYMSNVMEVLSRLYDGEIEKKGTISRGIEDVGAVHVSFASATTPYIMTLMDDNFFWQGTGNRILWIVDESIEKIDEKEAENFISFFWPPETSQGWKNEFDRLLGLLSNIRNLPGGQMTLSFGAGAMLNKYRIEKYNKAVALSEEDMMNRDSSFIAGLAQNAMKLALVHAIGRFAVDPDAIFFGMLEIDERDTEWAINKVERHMQYYHRLWELASRVRKGTIPDYKTDQERVIYTIRKLEETGRQLTANVLRQQTGWMKDNCQELLDTMVMNGDIRLVQKNIIGKTISYYTTKGA